MLNTKKDVDQHVRKSLSKCKTDNERNFRGFAIGKLYYRINEFLTAQQYISGYLSVQEDNPAGHKLLGQCYQRLKKPDKALEAYQRSLQLDSKQPDLLVEVCKLLLGDDNLNLNKAQYWCDLAELEKVNDDAVFNLRMKLLNKDNSGLKQMEETIRTEILNRPTDSKLRIRLMHYFIDKNQIVDAFKYAINLEYSSHDVFSNCSEWYNTVLVVLRKYQQLPNIKKDWNYWLLLTTSLERQVFLNFQQINSSSMPNAAFTETANSLFDFDHNLQEVLQIINSICEEKELANEFLRHFRGQLCLHAASLLFKREILHNKNQWKETTKIALPLLLLAYQCGSPDLQQSWLKHSGEKNKLLIQLWNKEGAFRCVQAGRCILSCVDEDTDEKSIIKQVNQYMSDRSLWNSSEALLFEIRQYCSDTSWRTKIFRMLFSNSDQTVKISSSHLVQNEKLNEPIYEIPSYADVESYEAIAQYLQPQSLYYMTYICLGKESLHQTRCSYFNGFNFSTKNLSFCGAESFNQLDLETFLYATVIQTKRTLEAERNCYDSYNSKSCGRPGILPYVNIVQNLCTDDQSNWWTAAFQVYKNLNIDNLGEIRANLQHGIEAVRGINGPKIDLIIVLKLGKIFINRSNEAMKSIEKSYLEQRAQNLFKLGLNMLKLQNKGVLEPFRRLFKYPQANSSKIEREVNKLAEEAITYLAISYFKNSEYEEAIEEFQGIELPYAAYFQSEAYRKLDESNKTPIKTKRFYEEKARDCLNHTLTLLENNSENHHPLNNIIQSQIKRSQFTNHISDSLNENTMNGNTSFVPDNRYVEGEYLNETVPIMIQLNRSVRSHTPQKANTSAPSNVDLENLVKQMANTLTFLKEEFVDSIKPEISIIKKDIHEMKEKMTKMVEEQMQQQKEQEQKFKQKSSETPSRGDDGASNVLDDLYIIDDEIQNQLYQSQQHHQQQNIYSVSNIANQQRMHTPNLNQQHLSNNPYINSALYNSNYAAAPMNYFPPYMMPTQQQINQAAASVVAAQRSAAALGLGGYHLTYSDPMNINLPQPQTQLPIVNQPSIPLNIDSKTIAPSTNLYNLLQQNQPMTQQVSTIQPILTTSTTSWNKISISNQPVEKGPPHNVVITSSDPLPLQNVVTSQSHPTLSVTIPTHHIKPSLVLPNDSQSHPPTSTTSTLFNMFSKQTVSIPQTITTETESSSTVVPFTFNFPKTTIDSTSSLFSTSTPTSMSHLQNTSPKLNRTSESADENELYKSADAEYDPRPDFKPIIPLPAEIEVRTGEENEEILFCHRAKLFRSIEKEWKERGVGDIKILKNKTNGKFRIIMRRDQTHKICANHQITSDLKMQQAKDNDKNYIWAANDFADEQLKYEKFCIRFKYAEKAKEFYDCFTKCTEISASDENERNSNIDKVISNVAKDISNETEDVSKLTKENYNKPKDNSVLTKDNSTIVNNQNILSATIKTPLSFAFNNSTQPNEPKLTTNPSPFANFSFTKDGSTDIPKPFTNIFQSSTSQNNPPYAVTTFDLISNEQNNQNNISNKSADNDGEDHFEPNVHFEPVIPLPAEIQICTGEENENILFEHRAKLLRFDKTVSEWKERGLGNIKILQDKVDNNKVRLLMRREIIHKLCCNQLLSKEMKFKHPTNMQNALQWVGKDFSENELTTETFTIRFKTADICKNFHDVILKVQNKMVNDLQSNENDKQKDEVKGFGNQFKPKMGSWSCKDCYVSNAPEANYCISCQASKNDTVPKKENQKIVGVDLSTKSKFNFGFGNTNENKPLENKTLGFGDSFKPKVGSWNCKDCYTNNGSDQIHCAACEAPKDATIPKKEPVNLFSDKITSKFTFGFNNANSPNSELNKVTQNQGFGNQFKPKTGSWICNTCYVDNIGGDGFCVACKAEKNESSNQLNIKSTSAVTQNKTAILFNPTVNSTLVNSTNTNDKSNSAFNFGPSFVFGPKINSASVEPTIMSKPGGFAFHNNENEAEYSLGKKEFSFQFKTKSPGKIKSPLKSYMSGTDDNNESDEECVEEENNTYFTPVIPLPDKIDVVTGEENEEVLYSHRAKLYRYVDSEWKERGLGDVKILCHKETKNLRVVMRREQVLKICLNHVLNSDVEYKNKDEKSWLFAVNDFSEGELKLEQFSLRFKNKDIAEDFMNKIKSILNNKNDTSISEEHKKLADKLKLPYNFFMEPATNCPGCNGCDPDNFVFPSINKNPETSEYESDALPLEHKSTNLKKKNECDNSMLKSNLFSLKQSPEINEIKNLFFNNMMKQKDDDSSNIFANIPKPASSFSFTNKNYDDNLKTAENKTPGGFLFSNNSKENLFNINSNKDGASSIFGGSIFANSAFNIDKPKDNPNKPDIVQGLFGQSASISNGTLFSGTGSNATPVFGVSAFGSVAPKEIAEKTEIGENNIVKNKQQLDENNAIFKSSTFVDFASLAKTNDEKPAFLQITESNPSGFIGLTHQNAFSSFEKGNQQLTNTSNQNVSGTGGEEDGTYDPHYEPIIELPKEIIVSTGEENEEKIYGERAHLFRFDDNIKEWKERGVGELKILFHPVNRSYRLILRREQIHKLVLNHAIAIDFHMKPMLNSPKAFFWGAVNYAEQPPQTERLAVRFKNPDLASKFERKINECLEELKKTHADLEPEED